MLLGMIEFLLSKVHIGMFNETMRCVLCTVDHKSSKNEVITLGLIVDEEDSFLPPGPCLSISHRLGIRLS